MPWRFGPQTVSPPVSPEQLSDEELVRLALKEATFFKFLIERYEGKLLAYIHRFIHCAHEDAEDILQEALIKTYRNLASFGPPLKFSSWIYRIVHNEAVSFLRRNKLKIQEDDENYTLLHSIAADTNVEEDAEKSLNKATVKAYLDTLPEKNKAVLTLRYFEEKEYSEIADILRLPIGTVATLINRSKLKLRQLITDQATSTTHV